jgi:hypothetical protein
MKVNFMTIFIGVFLIFCFIFTTLKNFKTLRADNYKQLAIALTIGIFSLSLLIFFYYLRGVDTEKPTILLKLLIFKELRKRGKDEILFL